MCRSQRLRRLVDGGSPVRTLALLNAAKSSQSGSSFDKGWTEHVDDSLWSTEFSLSKGVRSAVEPAITEEGQQMCAAITSTEAGGWLPRMVDEDPMRGLVLCAPGARYRHTAELILGSHQPNGDTWQLVTLPSASPLQSGLTAAEVWPPAMLRDCSGPITLSTYHELVRPEGVALRLRAHALLTLHDLIVELERDALLYPIVNEPKGERGNSVLFSGDAVYLAELALLVSEILGLGWEAQKLALGTALGCGDVLVLRMAGGGEGIRVLQAPKLLQ